MESYKHEDWFKKELQKYIDKYSLVPPPWVFDPESHPYSIRWRMGGGETFIMVLGGWAEDVLKTESVKIEYLKKYPPPPRWMAWAADFIWDLDPWETDDFDYTPYFEKLKSIGFKGTSEYLSDLDDEKWRD
ncbi:hypothetical protein WBG78_07735 [Chryseolinea sp. T2]|uniref:hypothetical protein n=1 Tax=Chryseolinea sp. T2 TaxID=3129255 RepID=UPI00307731D4